MTLDKTTSYVPVSQTYFAALRSCAVRVAGGDDIVSGGGCVVDRRTVLASTVAAIVGTTLTPLIDLARASAGNKRLFKISLAEWSLHRTLFSGGLDHLDFARTAKDGFGIEAVEYVNVFFKDKAADRDYIREMRTRAEDAAVRSLLIMIDGEGALGDADRKKRREAVENHYKWVEAAKSLGCHSIRVNARSSGSHDEQIERAADGLRRLTEFAAEREINVIVENHGGLSSNGKWLVAVMKRVNHPRCGTLPDFGNFNLGDGKWYDRYEGVKEMMPFAKAVSAKSHDFDADGNETETDFRRMIKIVADAGYHGYIGIEYEGSKLSEPDGIRATKRLLERVRDGLS